MIKSRSSERGGIGVIVLLIVLLVVSYLVIQNFQKMGVNSVSMPGTNERVSATEVIDKFKGDVKKIEDLQNQALPPLNPAE